MNNKIVLLVIVIVLIFVVAFIYSNSLSNSLENETNEHFITELEVKNGKNKILLMFAHPDDETMFFTPTLLALKKGGADIHFLCLSNGDHKNLGETREQEMQQLANYLGIPQDRVKIEGFLDQPGLKWNASEVANTLEHHVRDWKIHTVITFDGRGVSGHTNHISCYEGAKELKNRIPNVDFYALNSGGKRTRYLGTLVEGSTRNSRKAVSNSARKAIALMKNHRSQNTWWRKLHIALSSHTYVNHLTKI